MDNSRIEGWTDAMVAEALQAERRACATSVCDWCRLAAMEQPVAREHIGAARWDERRREWQHLVYDSDIQGRPRALVHVQVCRAGGIWQRGEVS